MNEETDIVTFKLTKEKAKILNDIIKEREAYNIVTSKLKNLWVFGCVAGLMILIAFGEKIHSVFIKV